MHVRTADAGTLPHCLQRTGIERTKIRVGVQLNMVGGRQLRAGGVLV